MKHYILWLTVTAFFVACKNDDKPAAKTAPVYQLDNASIYKFDSVVAYLSQLKVSQEDTGKQLFLEAIDLLKNKKDAQGSIVLFEKSLRFYPTNKSFYELGNALLEANKDSMAYYAFDMAEKLNYNPLSYVLYKKACALAASAGENDYDQQQKAMNYLKNAIENGFTDRQKIYGEPKLAILRTNQNLDNVYNEAMSGNGDPATILWDGFSTSFKQCSFPLTINMESMKQIKQPLAIGYDYEKFVSEMRDYKFSREVGNEFFYYAKVAATPVYETVIYGSRSYETGENMPYTPTQFYIASYDKKGKLIDKTILAGQEAYDQPFNVAALQANLNFEVKTYKNTWEKPLTAEGFANNSIVKSDLVNTTNYKISPDGKFVSDAKILGFIPNPVFESLQ